MISSRTCSKCGIEKSSECFTSCKNSKNGTASQCKQCLAKISRLRRSGGDWRNSDFGRMKFGIVDYGIDVKRCFACHEMKPISGFYGDERISSGLRGTCRTCYAADTLFRTKQKPIEVRRAYGRAHYAKHSEAIKTKVRESISTPRAKIDNIISAGVCRGIKRGSKNGRRSFDLIGYSLDELMSHLESKFEPWMSWDNYGFYGWHIDHIRPLSSFNYETPDCPEFKLAWALSNLRPLAASENIAKGSKWDPANDNVEILCAA